MLRPPKSAKGGLCIGRITKEYEVNSIVVCRIYFTKFFLNGVNTMDKPYINFKFLGINSFFTILENSKNEYRVFEDDYSSLYTDYKDLLNEEDTIISGILIQEGEHLFFTEIGLKITKSYMSYFVFIFDHHPVIDDIIFIFQKLEDIINNSLDGVDISAIAESMENKKSGGHSIN